ncbi:MAG TPA: thioredoxin family protein [Phycisphaerales bacterium]|nr:thioredoxin family protein [Phycisphaerales bacterium]
MLTPSLAHSSFSAGLEYAAYAATGNADQQASWRAFHQKVALTPAQRDLLASFTRRVNVLAISGVWCGDCVQQMPMLDHIARANTQALHVRFVDRDEHKEVADQVRICGGLRVPTVLFFNEDFEFLSLYGDKSLARLRAIAQRSLGAACAVPSAPVGGEEVGATLQDWVNEFERAHLTARLSPKLRQRHGD